MRIGTFSDYKHCLGTIEYDKETNIYYGSLINVNFLIKYRAFTLDDLYEEFKSAVDAYLEENIKKYRKG